MSSRVRLLVVISSSTLLIILTLVAIAIVEFGSLTASIQYFQGQRLVIVPAISKLGSLAAGESRQVGFTITNLSTHSVQIIGANADCSCIAISGVPFTIPSGESRTLPVQATAASVPSTATTDANVSHRLVLFTDAPEVPHLTASVEWQQE